MKKNILKRKSGYNWQFANVGGVMRVNITSGQDIAHLGELDQKMWTVLSCPTVGLELDEKTLKMIDTDNDGKIRVQEVIATAQWLTTVLNNPDLLLRQEDFIPLSALNVENENGKKLERAIRQILKNLGLEKDSISIADTADIMAIFNKTRFNGDGIITENSTDDADLKQLIRECMDSVGSLKDRSGDDGVDTDLVENFYKQCADYKAWKDEAESRKDEVFPFGDDTEAALAAMSTLKDKINDYFMRCKLAAFNGEATAALDVSVARIETISEKDLSACRDEIATYPLARIRTDKKLLLDAEINPAWKDDFIKLKGLVFDKAVNSNELTEDGWHQLEGRFSTFVDWMAKKPEVQIEKLGYERIDAIVSQNRKDDLMAVIAQDKALESEANEIESVDKLLHCYRDFYVLLKNFVTFVDFYDKTGSKAIFQAGTLYLDQRSCNLCLKVSDMAKHNAMASFSGMYLVYCDCYSKQKNATMTIVAVLTNGEVNDIMVGKNCLFYDRNGLDWDAKVVKIIDNPISIREAFWSPYRKFSRFVETKINSMAASQDEKVTSNMTGKIDETGQSLAAIDPAAEPQKEKPQAFDIAKFAGIFAAIGLALGYIGSFLMKAINGFVDLHWWQMPLVIIGLLLIISGPSMIIAWLKLRKRNLAPVLDANGWAVNAEAYVSIPFGNTLTALPNFPKVKLQDPFAQSKKTPVWRKILYVFVLLGLIFAALYFTNVLSSFGLPFREETPAEETVADTTAVADSVAVPVTEAAPEE